MKIHHLNCATMCPPFAKQLLNQEGRLVCHCLLIESQGGLILVDTGFGVDDLKAPVSRLGLSSKLFLRPVLDLKEAAISQVKALGYKREDVRHIVVTHLDLDHAGGLPDFPQAEVHIYDLEHQAAMARRTLKEKSRYIPAHFAHNPKWVQHTVQGERWLDFEAVRALAPGLPEVLLVPLIGHTRGHCAVAVKEGDGWLLHCGDAYFHHQEMSQDPSCPAMFTAFQKGLAMNEPARVSNQERLRQLTKEHPEVKVFCAHDPVEYGRCL